MQKRRAVPFSGIISVVRDVECDVLLVGLAPRGRPLCPRLVERDIAVSGVPGLGRDPENRDGAEI